MNAPLHAITRQAGPALLDGLFDFLDMNPVAWLHVGDHALRATGLERFNSDLQALSPQSPTLTMDQMAYAARRALAGGRDGSEPSFVTSRMNALARLECVAEDPGWEAGDALRDCLRVAQSYVQSREDLIPDELPVVGRLDDAVLIDVVMHLLREDLAEYEDFCRFRQVAADFAGVAVTDTGLTRSHWLDSFASGPDGPGLRRSARGHGRLAPDPRSTLFLIT